MAKYATEKSIELHDGKLPSKGDGMVIFKKYPVGSDVDKELIFNFPYILHNETVFYIENHARVMFIIRGPPSTGKRSLSEMLTERYPNATYCCADRYFTTLFANAERTRETLKASHTYCQKSVEDACIKNRQTIIVQNTHMQKWEMQIYLDFAASYNYTVIMAITLYRFDCTPKALAENNTDGLDVGYFIKRLRQWEDVLPVLMGWFLSPNDSLYILSLLRKFLEVLLSDGKFCRVFNIYNTEDIIRYFHPRKLLFCLASYMKDFSFMKNYYLSDQVQSSYGKIFNFSIIGYLVSKTTILGIAYMSKDAKHFFLMEEKQDKDVVHFMRSLNMNPNFHHYSSTVSFPNDELSQATTATFEKFDDSEELEASLCSFIEVAQKDSKPFNIQSSSEDFQNAMGYLTDADGYVNYDECAEMDSDEDCKIYRLPNDVWLIKPFQKINVKSIFTGLYT